MKRGATCLLARKGRAGILTPIKRVVRALRFAGFCLVALATLIALFASAQKRTFTGIITDNMCPKGDHSGMRMGPTDAECTVACVAVHGASYVLFDGKDTYILSDQKTPEKFAAKKVTVTGTLDAKSKTIQVQSIAESK